MLNRQKKASREHMLVKLERARSRIDFLDARIAELEGQRSVEQVIVNALTKELGPEAKEKKADKEQESPGFRAVIRNVMREVNGGVTPSILAAEFEKRQIPYEGKTKLSVRLSNDLARMLVSGKVRKQNGLFFLSEGQSDAVN